MGLIRCYCFLKGISIESGSLSVIISGTVFLRVLFCSREVADRHCTEVIKVLCCVFISRSSCHIHLDLFQCCSIPLFLSVPVTSRVIHHRSHTADCGAVLIECRLATKEAQIQEGRIYCPKSVTVRIDEERLGIDRANFLIKIICICKE